MVSSKLISLSKNKKRAEVVAMYGSKSVTRHLQLRDGKWYGRGLEQTPAPKKRPQKKQGKVVPQQVDLVEYEF